MAKMELSNKTYDRTKPVALVWLPAIGALYFGLSQIWGFPYAEEVVGSIVVLEVFLGAVLGISSKNYEDHKEGAIVINEDDPDKDFMTIELDVPVDRLYELEELKFDVRHDSQEKQGL